jgi:chromosome segregation ATPase
MSEWYDETWLRIRVEDLEDENAAAQIELGDAAELIAALKEERDRAQAENERLTKEVRRLTKALADAESRYV